MVNFALAIVGRGPGMLPMVALGVAMFLGGISGSGPANAAAVGGVMLAAMARAGYPPAYSASVIGAAAATDILIPPSIAFIVYSVMVPGASVPALFAAGMVPGVLAGLALIVPAVWMARRHGFGAGEGAQPRPPFLRALREATWGLFAPVLILGGMRAGWFTPTEAAVVAVAYGLFVGMVVYRHDPPARPGRDLRRGRRDLRRDHDGGRAGQHLRLRGQHAGHRRPAGAEHPRQRHERRLGARGDRRGAARRRHGARRDLDLPDIRPLLLPLMKGFWLGSGGSACCSPTWWRSGSHAPMAVNLMVSSRLAGVRMEQTVPWVICFVFAMLLVLVAIIAVPDLALRLPRTLHY